MKPRSVIVTIEGVSGIDLQKLKVDVREALTMYLAEGSFTVSQVSAQVVQQPKPKK